MPSGGALFGNIPSILGIHGQVKHVVEMRAGKMELRGRMIYPDKRKGLIYVFQSEDSLMHFCWQDRTTGTVEEDLIIFPDDCEYVRIPQCTTGRAYVLKFRTSNRRFFFWLQEPKTDKDDEHCKRINEILNNPGTLNQQDANTDHDLQSLLNSMSQSQLIQLFGGSGQMGPLSSLLGTIRGPGSARTSSTPAITHRSLIATPPSPSKTPNVPATSASQNTPQNAPITTATPDAPKKNSSATTEAAAPSTLQPIQLSDLQNFLQNISPTVPQQQQQQQSVDLSTALTNDALSGVLSSPEALQQLQSHLPPVEGTTPQEALRTTVASPQFQNAVSQFSSALETGMLGPVVSQLSVNSEAVAAAAQGNMQEFVKALEKTGTDSEDTKKDDKKESPKDDKDDEKMQLD